MKRPSKSGELRSTTYRAFFAEYYNTSLLIIFIGWSPYKAIIRTIFPPSNLIFAEMCDGQTGTSTLYYIVN